MDNWMVLCFCILAAFCALVTATDDASKSVKEKVEKKDSYLPQHELAQWSRVIKSGIPQMKRYKGDSKAFHYGDLVQYLNSVGKRNFGGGKDYGDLVQYLNSVGKRNFGGGKDYGDLVQYLNSVGKRNFGGGKDYGDLVQYLNSVGKRNIGGGKDYGDLVQYLNSVGKRNFGGADKRRMENIRYSELVDYLNAVGKRGGDEKLVSPATAVNNPYFRRFEDAMKFENLRKHLQRVGR